MNIINNIADEIRLFHNLLGVQPNVCYLGKLEIDCLKTSIQDPECHEAVDMLGDADELFFPSSEVRLVIKRVFDESYFGLGI